MGRLTLMTSAIILAVSLFLFIGLPPSFPLISFYKIYRKIICAKSAKHGLHTFQSYRFSNTGTCYIRFILFAAG